MPCANRGNSYTQYMWYFVVQLLSHVWLFVTPRTAACQASVSFTISRSLLKLMFTELMMPPNHLILCNPLLLLPSIFPSTRVFSNEPGLHIRWPKYWSFSISPSSKYSGLISFRIDWLDLLAVQSTLKSLLHTTIQKHQFFSSQPIFYVLLRWLILFLYLSILLYTIFNSVSRFKSWNYSVYVCAPMYFTFYLLRKFSFWYLSYFLVSFYTKQSKKIF